MNQDYFQKVFTWSDGVILSCSGLYVAEHEEENDLAELEKAVVAAERKLAIARPDARRLTAKMRKAPYFFQWQNPRHLGEGFACEKFEVRREDESSLVSQIRYDLNLVQIGIRAMRAIRTHKSREKREKPEPRRPVHSAY